MNILTTQPRLLSFSDAYNISVTEGQRSRPCGYNLRVPFLRAVLPMEVKESA